MENKVWKYDSNKNDQLKKLVKENGKSIVMTNPEMAKYLIGRINFKEGELVCEPAKGDGAFFNNLPPNVIKNWYEINEGKDYLTGETVLVNTTLSNPPFVPRKLFWNFMLRAMETTTDRIFWLINIASMNVFTPKRLRIMKEKGWSISNQHIVADKRWYGRYCWLEINKKKNNYFSWCDGKAF